MTWVSERSGIASSGAWRMDHQPRSGGTGHRREDDDLVADREVDDAIDHRGAAAAGGRAYRAGSLSNASLHSADTK